jgi:hypothetical protein
VAIAHAKDSESPNMVEKISASATIVNGAQLLEEGRRMIAAVRLVQAEQLRGTGESEE